MKEENKLLQPYTDEEVSHLPQIKKRTGVNNKT